MAANTQRFKEEIERRFGVAVTILGDDESERAYHFRVDSITGEQQVTIAQYNARVHEAQDSEGRSGGPDTWVVTFAGNYDDYPSAFLVGLSSAINYAANFYNTIKQPTAKAA